MNDKRTCKDCPLKENCTEYKKNKNQYEDYESYNKPLTNEEWLKQCTTEQLAGFLADECNEVVETVLSDASCDIGDIDNDDYWYRQADFVEWLKEKHE